MFPTPKELGVSESNSLPIRSITPDVKIFTWEDYYCKLQELYPKKFWIYKQIQTILFFLNCNVYKPVYNVYWFIVYNTFKKYHFLDLRQVETNTIDSYKYGYRDPSSKMVYAMFNILDEYIKNTIFLTEDDVKNDKLNNLKYQYEHEQEAKYLHEWWHIYRKKDLQKFNDLQDKWYNLRKTHYSSKKEKQLFANLNKMEIDLEQELDEHLIRLVKIRKGLWI